MLNNVKGIINLSLNRFSLILLSATVVVLSGCYLLAAEMITHSQSSLAISKQYTSLNNNFHKHILTT